MVKWPDTDDTNDKQLRCQAMCPTAAYYRRGIQPCNNLAAVQFPNGLLLCGKHAGKHLLAQAVKRHVIKCVNTVPDKQPTVTKDIVLWDEAPTQKTPVQIPK